MTPRHSRRVSGARTRLSAGIGLASMLAPGIALAAANSAAVPTDLDAVVVTATASERSVERAPASVTVVSGEELRTRPARDVLDAIRDTPGLNIRAVGSLGRRVVSVRGMESRHTLVLVDGERIAATDQVFGLSDLQFGWIPLEAIERVEIVRGPLFGADRWRAIWQINTGQLDHLIDTLRYRYPHRFSVDPAALDPARPVTFGDSGVILEFGAPVQPAALELVLDSAGDYTLVYLLNGQQVGEAQAGPVYGLEPLAALTVPTPVQAKAGGFDQVHLLPNGGSKDASYRLALAALK